MLIQCPHCQHDFTIETLKEFIQENKPPQENNSLQKELQIKELTLALEAQKKLTDEMKRRMDQSFKVTSMSYVGAAQELVLNELLAKLFPQDEVLPIQKGAKGADCLLRILDSQKKELGVIYFESKRTKEFNLEWIDKFKLDMNQINASLGILVTQSMPSFIKKVGLYKGIWICQMEYVEGLVMGLRESLIQLQNVKSSHVEKEKKDELMHQLYDYLSSQNFYLQIEGIVEGFSNLKIELESEKRAMQRIWKQREKQIEKVLLHTIDMYSSLKGIAPHAITTLPSLEL